MPPKAQKATKSKKGPKTVSDVNQRPNPGAGKRKVNDLSLDNPHEEHDPASEDDIIESDVEAKVEKDVEKMLVEGGPFTDSVILAARLLYTIQCSYANFDLTIPEWILDLDARELDMSDIKDLEEQEEMFKAREIPGQLDFFAKKRKTFHDVPRDSNGQKVDIYGDDD
jgi:hypothetical protein